MEFNIAILAGGKSERFGSNKALFKIDGIPIISKLLMEIPKLSLKPKTICISLHQKEQLNEIIKGIKEFFKISKIDDCLYEFSINGDKILIKIVFDDKNATKGIRAAIIGLNSIFQEISSGFVLVIPCDTPNFNAQIINKILLELIANPRIDVLIPRWRNNFIESLNSVYKVETFKKKTEKNIQNNILRISKLFSEGINIKYFEIEENLKDLDPDFKSFKNFNTKD